MSQPPTTPQNHSVVQPSPGGGPFCANCGYSLKGLQIDGNCPECSTLIVRSVGGDSRPNGYAVASLVLGICAIVLTCGSYGLIGLICGPLALVYHAKAVAKVSQGLAPASSLGLARAGRICGWIGLGLSVLLFLFIGFFLFLGLALPFLAPAGGGGYGP
jgi:hypothetical protein